MADANATADVTLGVEPAGNGARFLIGTQDGSGTQLFALRVDRQGARDFAHAVLAAVGDGTQRTFCKPTPEAGRG